MTKLRLASVVVLVCLVEGAGRAVAAASARLSSAILQAELQRNMQVLTQQPVPAYYAAYTLHDTRTHADSRLVRRHRSQRRNRQRFATVEVRVGDYSLDNTHPMRGDARAMSPRLAAGQPAADRRREADSAGAVARHRSQLQAGQRGADAREDERRRESAG